MRSASVNAVARGTLPHYDMRIAVLYFAVFRERIGRSDEELALPDRATVGDAIAALAAKHKAIADLAGRFRVAANREFVDDSRVLRDGDELVLIPPVAGGSGARHVLLTDRPVCSDRCIAAVAAPERGGVVTFAGNVRAHSHGDSIEYLEYEAYEPMAVLELTRLCDAIEQEIRGARLAVEHRVGRLEVGDTAVFIAAAAPHRAEAFAACRAMIDRLKESVPIWKKEVGRSGQIWVGLGA